MIKLIKRIIKKLFPRTIRLIRNRIAIHKIKGIKPTGNKTPKIVFICQSEHIWDKTKPVADEMVNRNYDVILFVVKDEVVSYKNKNIFECYGRAPVVFYEKGKLKDLKPDYVFYSRPYDVHLPEDIRSGNVVKFAKTCYIPYGYSFMNIGDVNLNIEFTKNIVFTFADNQYAADYVNSHNAYLLKRTNYCYNVGYPYFDDLKNNFEDYINQSVDCFKSLDNYNNFKLIWTPRWTTDEKIGGSNFFKYWKNILEYVTKNEDINFVFRPHPLAFMNYLQTGQITETEKDEYLKSLANTGRCVYDDNNTYLGTFFSSDAIITDVSSIIGEYLFTKKPIIFCHNQNDNCLNDITKEMFSIFYNVYSFEDIEKILNDLRNGIDPLKTKRETYIDNFEKTFDGTTERIVDIIIEDFKKNNKNN
jgi:hypothetical protein